MTKAAFILGAWLEKQTFFKQQFAYMVGVKPWTLSRFLSGRLVPPLTVALQIEKTTYGKVKVKDWAIPHMEAAE